MAKIIGRHSVENARVAGSDMDEHKRRPESLEDLKKMDRRGEENQAISNTKGYKGRHRK